MGGVPGLVGIGVSISSFHQFMLYNISFPLNLGMVFKNGSITEEKESQ